MIVETGVPNWKNTQMKWKKLFRWPQNDITSLLALHELTKFYEAFYEHTTKNQDGGYERVSIISTDSFNPY